MKISIITVALNSEILIKNSIESVVKQNYQNIEYIIIDGGSLDHTISIAKTYKKHISKLISEPDKGIYDAMNKGLKIATGEIIGFLNSDDIYATNKVLSNVATLFKNKPFLDACYADLIYTDRIDTSKIVRYWKSSEFIPGSFSKGWCPPHPTFFVRRSVYERFGKFNLSYDISSDCELMMRFLEVHKINATYKPELWVKMRMGGLSNKSFKNILNQNQEVLIALKKHGLKKNIFIFFAYKTFLRLKQFFYRPSN
jgi:glycosyltransferase involved in cell wall biosynthesis